MTESPPIKRHKNFLLEIPDELHKLLKHKAIECDQSLHSYIIETLASSVKYPNKQDKKTEITQ